MTVETLAQKVRRVIGERITIEPYNPEWPKFFDAECEHLYSCLPEKIIGHIEHFGSTAIPGLAAKPIIDMLIEVTSLEKAKTEIVPILESQGYDYFWRPTFGDKTPPFYVWFIKRDTLGQRTHHLHMIEKSDLFAQHWDRLLFRDYLRVHGRIARDYEQVKRRHAEKFETNRKEYTYAKTDFIQRITQLAKKSG